MPQPNLFISHKHSDCAIARVLADFFEEKSNGGGVVHLSSSPDFAGPKFGSNLNAQLREALWHTDVLVLVYTSEDEDWSWCMWECGVATDSQSPETSVIVFQCGADVPTLFGADLRVNPRNPDDLQRFVNAFLRDPTFFPKLGGALAPNLKDQHIKNAAKDLNEKLSQVLPPPDEGLSKERPTWPYLRIELPRRDADQLERSGDAERAALSLEIVQRSGVIVESDERTARMFGRADSLDRMELSQLLKSWSDKNPGAEAIWFESCCEQIGAGAANRFPIIRPATVREEGSESDYTPVLARVKPRPYAGMVQFDIFFFNLADPRAMPVMSRMIAAGNFFYKTIGGDNPPPSVRLTELLADLESRNLNRVPILNSDGHAIQVIHRSMIDKFIVDQVIRGGVDPAGLTLADDEMRTFFDNSFVIVNKRATLAEANKAMQIRPNCSDAFVTAEGTQDEPVLGWLTNVDIAKSN